MSRGRVCSCEDEQPLDASMTIALAELDLIPMQIEKS